MFRRFLKNGLSRSESGTSDELPALSSGTPSKAPPPTAFHAQEKQQEVDANTLKVEELAPFDACIEACDALASTSQSSGRVDPKTGLVDCSVLVSGDGDILIIPQEQQKISEEKSTPSSVGFQRSDSFVQRTVTQLGKEYESAVFVGNDLAIAGDKALNGFSAKGWSIPAASLAIKQSSDTMVHLADFVEDLILTKKSCAAQESQMIDKLRPLVDGQELSQEQLENYQSYIKDAFPDQNFEVSTTRVGPLSCPGGTVQETVVALENYYATIAESESQRWRAFAEQPGPLANLREAKVHTDERSLNRQAALQEMFRRAKAVEGHLNACKADAASKWDDVHEAEEQVTRLVEEKMIERSQLRQQQRLEQIKQDEEKRAKDAAHGNLGATSSEIWDIVSAVAASMEEGSFEPMDLPQAPIAGPRDKSHEPEAIETEIERSDSDSFADFPMASRHELEQECGLPELRVAALAADEAVNDAANSLLSVLSNWDITSRSARLAAETCLVSACNAQAACLKAIVKSERQLLREREKLLNDLEKIANNIDVRADMNHYITLDKKMTGGGSFLGDDDDGGIASALAVLNNHIDGNMGLGNLSTVRQSVNEGVSEQDTLEPEDIEAGVEKMFKKNPLLRADAPDNEKTELAREQFEVNILQLCRIAKDKSSAGRARRSTICYSMNAKRSVQEEIPSEIQFEGLCRVFHAVLSGCDTSNSGVSLAKMMMTMSQSFFLSKEDGPSEGGENQVFVKSKLIGHPLWEKEEFWDQALYQIVAESLTHSGVMSNFERTSARTSSEKKKSEWTEAYKMKWHDLKEQERYQAASQVHAIVFAQLGAMSHSMIEFGCGLERSCAFVRRMAVRNQLPVSQRAMLLEHLVERENDDGSEKPPVKLTTPAR